MKKSTSRTINSRNNFVTGMIAQILVLIMGFICRTIFIDVLGKQYLGVNNAFTDIIGLLSLTELGLGTAILYQLYKPIATEDNDRIYVLMKFYKQAYQLIGVSVIVIGLLILPFLTFLIKKDLPPNLNIYLIFLLYLGQSASTYFFFAYKSAIIRANQQSSVIYTFDWWFTIASNLLQILELLFIGSFELYVAITIVTNAVENLLIARKSDQLFPFLKEKRTAKISWEEAKKIIKDCYALSLWKINSVLISTTDNLCLTVFMGFGVVGVYSNYQLLRMNVGKFLDRFYTAITASIGNLNATKADRNLQVYRVTNFVTSIMYGITGLGFYFVANPFIRMWLNKDYILSDLTVLLLAIDMYVSGINKLSNTYRSALGLFNYMKYRPLLGSAVNIVVSVWLVQSMGVAGVVIGTIACKFLIYFWFEPLIIYRYGFHKNPLPFYIKNLGYMVMWGGLALAIHYSTQFLSYSSLLLLLVRGSLSVIVPLAVIWLLFGRSYEMKYLKANVLNKLFKRFKT